MEPPTAANTDAPVRGRSSRLKRRVGTTASQAISISETDDIKDEPPLKKFKALFEESDPDRVTSGSLSSNEAFSLTQTQTQVRGKTLLNGAGLEVVREEEESQPSGSVTRAKRKAGTLEDDRSGDVEVENGQIESSTKKRAVENTNAVVPSGKPDTDAAFLKALASTKRGKKNENAFDREFNKLKISKPDLSREEQEKEWAVLEDFGDERNIRGNFMVVLEMDVYKKEGQNRESNERVEWEARPNFKRFKKKIFPGARKTVELVVTQENDYGMGSAYWKGGNSQSQSQSNDCAPSQPSRSRTKLPTQSQRKASAFAADGSDEGIVQEIAPRRSKAKAPSRAASQRPEAPQRLFLDLDEEHDDEEDDVQTLQSHGTRRSTRGTGTKKEPAAVVVDDDSDDGVTFKGFGTKKKGGRNVRDYARHVI